MKTVKQSEEGLCNSECLSVVDVEGDETSKEVMHG